MGAGRGAWACAPEHSTGASRRVENRNRCIISSFIREPPRPPLMKRPRGNHPRNGCKCADRGVPARQRQALLQSPAAGPGSARRTHRHGPPARRRHREAERDDVGAHGLARAALRTTGETRSPDTDGSPTARDRNGASLNGECAGCSTGVDTVLLGLRLSGASAARVPRTRSDPAAAPGAREAVCRIQLRDGAVSREVERVSWEPRASGARAPARRRRSPAGPWSTRRGVPWSRSRWEETAGP